MKRSAHRAALVAGAYLAIYGCLRCAGVLEHVVEESSVRRYYRVRVAEPSWASELRFENRAGIDRVRLWHRVVELFAWAGMGIEDATVNCVLIVRGWTRPLK